MLRRIREWVMASHLLKFLIVGGLSFALDLGLLVVLHELFLVDLWIATPIAFLVSLAFNFLLQRSFTFQSDSKAHISLVKYGALVVFNLVATDVIVNFFDHVGAGYGIGKAVATISTTVWNFFLYKHWIFRQAEPTPEPLDVSSNGD
ncbi:GtrA family protein [Arthrobacter sp. M4]|uniref:GtrA family protein n=1 Tax=Arthrobacter sp. M4 TaxID=218160 RepID=UPI001CDD8C45|nr:GtrA family protein [Arthrobacter sp. M4]MCA4132242.1 GtrA family protein [Arthrobacter sp. M4]